MTQQFGRNRLFLLIILLFLFLLPGFGIWDG